MVCHQHQLFWVQSIHVKKQEEKYYLEITSYDARNRRNSGTEYSRISQFAIGYGNFNIEKLNGLSLVNVASNEFGLVSREQSILEDNYLILESGSLQKR